MKSDIHPPRTGLNSDPVLYGVAAALEELFPPVQMHDRRRPERQAQGEGKDEKTKRD